MSALTNSIQDYNDNQCSKVRKRNKRHPDLNGRCELTLFTNKIVYVENTMEFTPNLLKLKSKFSKHEEYRINI